MKDRLVSWIKFIGGIISASLPEDRFKELLRRYFWRRFDPLYALDKIISRAELLQGSILFVELNNGTRFYGPQDGVSCRRVKQADPHRLGKMKAFEYFGGILGLLREQYVESVYEKYYVLQKGDIIVDVGAHIGTFTVKAAKAVGSEGRVIAIEPEANNRNMLQRNIEANELQNVVIVPKGVWNAKDTLKLNLFEGGTGLSSFHRSHFDGTDYPDALEEVQVDTLDNILGELGMKRVDFIKMDIEGAEIEAIKGMDDTLRNNDVKLAIAAYHIVNGKMTHKTIIPQLREKGFEIQRGGGIVYASKKI